MELLFLVAGLMAATRSLSPSVRDERTGRGRISPARDFGHGALPRTTR
jgi:hypothetical protein